MGNFIFKNFFWPKINRIFLIRLGILALFSYLFFGYLCLPMIVNGPSMEPTYFRKGVNFCWTPKYIYSKPKRQDVVIVRFAGKDLMLLKRIVAFEGETVEFRNGCLYINGIKLDEPYVKFPCDWNLPPRIVAKSHVYVVGDNRSMPIEIHEFGQVSETRIAGVPLW